MDTSNYQKYFDYMFTLAPEFQEVTWTLAPAEATGFYGNKLEVTTVI